jgi:hypothetical protein|tara:strand:+ start:1016 stop:1720 length:705 start_codon:yes stop_codon:yes gene_type:complete
MKVAIVGLGGSYSDYIAARIRSETYDETWGINCIGGIIEVDKTIMMDPVSRFLDTEDAGSQTGIAKEFLAKNTKPIITCELDDRVKHLEEYPLEAVIKELNICYFNNTVAYAIAYAIWYKAHEICLYGIDYNYKNVSIAEAGRACCEFWCAIAVSRGIKIEVAHTSGLLDTNVPDNERLYGYHRLKDPLVQTFNQNGLLITRQSEMTPPEPLDAEPTLIGRHDLQKLNGKEQYV